jgi:hypothetical protein
LHRVHFAIEAARLLGGYGPWPTDLDRIWLGAAGRLSEILGPKPKYHSAWVMRWNLELDDALNVDGKPTRMIVLGRSSDVAASGYGLHFCK